MSILYECRAGNIWPSQYVATATLYSLSSLQTKVVPRLMSPYQTQTCSHPLHGFSELSFPSQRHSMLNQPWGLWCGFHKGSSTFPHVPLCFTKQCSNNTCYGWSFVSRSNDHYHLCQIINHQTRLTFSVCVCVCVCVLKSVWGMLMDKWSQCCN